MIKTSKIFAAIVICGNYTLLSAAEPLPGLERRSNAEGCGAEIQAICADSATRAEAQQCIQKNLSKISPDCVSGLEKDSRKRALGILEKDAGS